MNEMWHYCKSIAADEYGLLIPIMHHGMSLSSRRFAALSDLTKLKQSKWEICIQSVPSPSHLIAGKDTNDKLAH